MSIEGVYAAALTPMHEDYRCNDEALANHCQDLMQRGCSGVVLFGTTGEGSSFTVEERENTFKNVIKLGVDPQKIILGISCCAIQDVLRLAACAISQNCAAILVVPPFFYKKVDDAGVIAFYKAVLEELRHSDMKVILYHIPQLSGVHITIPVIKALLEEFPETVIGMKDSEGNMTLAKEILATFPGFKLVVGKELLIAECVKLGSVAAISGIANAYPELICSLFKCDKSAQEKAQRMMEEVRKYPIFPAIKNIVEMQKGTAWHVLRPPLVPLSEEQSQALVATSHGVTPLM